jgi:hypothetical protein
MAPITDARKENTMTFRSTLAAATMLAVHPAVAQEHRFEADPVVSVRENFVACDVLSHVLGPRNDIGAEFAGKKAFRASRDRVVQP